VPEGDGTSYQRAVAEFPQASAMASSFNDNVAVGVLAQLPALPFFT